METVPKRGRTVHNTTVSTSKARSTAKENFFGTMVQVIVGISLQMIFMVMVTTHGAINGNTRASGNEIRCMDMAFSPGVMAKSMKGLTSMIKSLATVFSSGLMGVCMTVCGRRGSSMGSGR